MPDTSLGFPYPASSDDVQLWTKFQALAEAVNAFLELPDDVSASVSGNITITAASFSLLPAPGPLNIVFSNPSADYDLLVDVSISTLMLSSTSTTVLQVSLAASGGVSFPATAGGGGPLEDSEILRTNSASFEQGQVTYPVLIPAGAAPVTFAVGAMRSAATSCTLNDPVLRIKPRRFQVP